MNFAKKKIRLAVVSPFLDKSHGTERIAVEWIAQIAGEFGRVLVFLPAVVHFHLSRTVGLPRLRNEHLSVDLRRHPFPIASVIDNSGDCSQRNCLSGQVKSGQRWSGQNRPTERPGTWFFLTCFLLLRQVRFGAPASWSALEYVTVV